MIINRTIRLVLERIAHQFPVIALIGPRQSGKTTIAQLVFSKHTYISLEDLDIRAQAQKDPREFLEFYKNPYGLILDEIQNVPTLLSYIQTQVDKSRIPGYFILTGSQNYLVTQQLSQSLAGRVAIFTLLPLSISELKLGGLLPNTIEELVYKGSYPGLYVQPIDLPIWYSSYILTYLERDVRQLTSIKDLTTFQLFLKLCAGRTGQLLNLSSLANDCGINLKTAQGWLSLLQATYIVFLLQPHYKNFNKRLIKTPKLYFYDTGLVCSLLGITSSEQLKTHYLRGSLVECLIISNFFKESFNIGRIPQIYFWRDNHGHEVDCLLEQGERLIPIEIKAGRTVSSDYFSELVYWSKLANIDPSLGYIVYAGLAGQRSKHGQVVPWKDAHTIAMEQQGLTSPD